MTRIIIMMICTSGVIFGGRRVLRRWVYRQRMRRNARYNRKLREAVYATLAGLVEKMKPEAESEVAE